jgi:hypothetical protein
LEFTLAALEPSSLFSIDISRDAASRRPVSLSVDSTDLFCKNFFFFFFSHRGHLQALKVCDLKLFMSASIVQFKRPNNQSRKLN